MAHGTEKRMAEQRQQQQDARTTKAFKAQMDTINSLKAGLMKYVTGSEGFDPALLSALKTQFLGSNARDFSNARQSVLSGLARRGSGGGDVPVGGDYARGLSDLAVAEASTLSQGMTGINISNLQQALTNKFNAASVLSGNAATLNSPISTFTNSADNALNERIKIGLTPGFGSAFMSGLGGGLASIATGGISKGLGSLSNIFKPA